MTDSDSLSVVPLHQHPELTKQCCDLVNEEWPRSETARMMSLKTSCDKMPTCLVLLDGAKNVIGHCKLTPIPSIGESCFVESLVISKPLRGKGLGTFLMRASEEYCRSALGLRTVHLSTIDKMQFYSHLGYAECEPVNIYGSFPPLQNGSGKIYDRAPPPPPMINFKRDNMSKKPNKTYMVKTILT